MEAVAVLEKTGIFQENEAIEKDLEINIEKHGDVLQINLVGDLSYRTYKKLKNKFGEFVSGGNIKFEINFSDLEFIDIEGLSALIVCSNVTKKLEGGTLELIGDFQPQVKKKFEVTPLRKAIEIHPTLDGFESSTSM